MASLGVPTEGPPAINPKTSISALRPRMIPHDNSLGPIGHTRRASQEDIESPVSEAAIPPCTQASGGFELPKTKSSDTLKHDLASKSISWQAAEAAVDRHSVTLVAVDELDLPHADGKLPSRHQYRRHAHLGTQRVKTIYAGPSGNQKQLQIPTDLLEAKSRFFQRVFEHDSNMDHMVFDDADPIAMGMFVHWLVVGSLEEPDSFHSLTHWHALYALSVRFEMEELRNHGAMDMIRHYYRHDVQTASPFRLEFVYKFTPEDDQMRGFVIATAASRALVDGVMSASMREVISKGGDISVDYAQALINYSRDPTSDVCASPDCQWHLHHHTQPCKGSQAVQGDVA